MRLSKGDIQSVSLLLIPYKSINDVSRPIRQN